MNDIDATPAKAPIEPVRPVEPLTPMDRVAAPTVVPILADETPPTRARATSSRSLRGRGLVGIIAISLLSASLSAAITVGVLGGTASDAGAATATSMNPTGTTPVAISASDAVVAVAESASPAVVTITVDVASTGFRGQPLQGTGVGSGFVFDAAGLILTNAHVIDDSSAGGITVTFQDGTQLPGTVVATDPTLDLAVVQVTPATAHELPTIEIGDSDALEVGQLVVAIGSPLGTFTETVTSGILSATDRTIEVAGQNGRSVETLTGLLQTDAAINEGNSGGPLLDATGRAIGVNVAVATSAQGIGFAIPIDAASRIMAEAKAGLSAA